MELTVTKNDALNQIAAGIRRCFGDIDLEFQSDVSGEDSASGLKDFARREGLKREEIKDAIYPSLKRWLDAEYQGFLDNKDRPWRKDAAQRESKALSMAIEAAYYLADS